MFFFHHIGTVGSARDFPKTVSNKLRIEDFQNFLSDRPDVIDRLRTRFPDGFCNAWGVPAGASTVIRTMSDGDHVLLVAHTAGEGEVPALCFNVTVADGENWELSNHFWGESKFPLIFFFDTEELSMTWKEMCRDLGFKENYSPRLFLRIRDDRLEKFGGDIGYLAHIRSTWGQRRDLFAHPTHSESTMLGGEILGNEYSVTAELEALANLSHSDPTLTGEGHRMVKETNSFARSKAFSLSVLRAYAWKCAVCQCQIFSPTGAYWLEAAHIYPKSKDGSDDVRNGIALCPFHHWAFDVGWITIQDNWTITVSEDLPDGKDFDNIRELDHRPIYLPQSPEHAPHRLFLREHRLCHGFEENEV